MSTIYWLVQSSLTFDLRLKIISNFLMCLRADLLAPVGPALLRRTLALSMDSRLELPTVCLLLRESWEGLASENQGDSVAAWVKLCRILSLYAFCCRLFSLWEAFSAESMLKIRSSLIKQLKYRGLRTTTCCLLRGTWRDVELAIVVWQKVIVAHYVRQVSQPYIDNLQYLLSTK